jgi:hypothetical protein
MNSGQVFNFQFEFLDSGFRRIDIKGRRMRRPYRMRGREEARRQEAEDLSAAHAWGVLRSG